MGRGEIGALLEEMQADDARALSQVRFARRFDAGPAVAAVAAHAYGLFAHAGRVSPYPGFPAPPGMAAIQADLEAWALGLMHAPEGAAAVLTSGGTESVILAARAAALAAERGLPPGGPGEILAAHSAHPCIDKAAELLGLRLIRLPGGADFRADPARMESAIGPRTIMLYGSFPSYAYGLDDDIGALGAMARRHGLWLHVDACMSGFLAPFMRMNGEPIAPFDFEVPGVSSISADWHKHGYAGKGASTLLLRAGLPEPFLYRDHPLPPMATATLAGTAAGAPFASAWAVARHLGVEGYRALARQMSDTRAAFIAAVEGSGDFRILDTPRFSVIVVLSDRYDMAAIHMRMAARGWFTLSSHAPAGLHLNLSALDGALAEDFLADLRAAAAELQ